MDEADSIGLMTGGMLGWGGVGSRIHRALPTYRLIV